MGGLHGGLAREIARFPKLFKRLTESIATRVVPDWLEASRQAALHAGADVKQLGSRDGTGGWTACVEGLGGGTVCLGHW